MHDKVWALHARPLMHSSDCGSLQASGSYSVQSPHASQKSEQLLALIASVGLSFIQLVQESADGPPHPLKIVASAINDAVAVSAVIVGSMDQGGKNNISYC